MGMFDHVECKYILPHKNANKVAFQTKDLNNLLDTYTITKAGYIYHHRYKLENIRKRKNSPPFPMYRRIDLGKRKMDFHGDLNIYGTDDEGNWHEYDLRFTEGKVSKVLHASVIPASGEREEEDGSNE